MADEVRKLAERTSKVTGEIGSLIEVIRNGISTTDNSMQEANHQAADSLQLVGQSEAALDRIGRGSSEVETCVVASTSALAEQDAAIRAVAINIEKIAQMTEVNNEAAEAHNCTAKALDRLSVKLRESVAIYRT